MAMRLQLPLLLLASLPLLLSAAHAAPEKPPPRQQIADVRADSPGAWEALQLETLRYDLQSATGLFMAIHGRLPTDLEELREAGLVLLEPLDGDGKSIPLQPLAADENPPPGVIGVTFAGRGRLVMMGAGGDPAKPMEHTYVTRFGLTDPLVHRKTSEQLRAEYLRGLLQRRRRLYVEIHEAQPPDVVAMLGDLRWQPPEGRVLGRGDALPAGMMALLVDRAAEPEPDLLRYRFEPAELGYVQYEQLYDYFAWPRRLYSGLERYELRGWLEASEPGVAEGFVSVGGIAVPVLPVQAPVPPSAGDRYLGPKAPRPFMHIRQTGQLLHAVKQTLEAKLPGQAIDPDLLKRTQLIVELPTLDGRSAVALRATTTADGIPPASRAPGLYLGTADGQPVLTLAEQHRNVVVGPGRAPAYTGANDPVVLTPAAEARAAYQKRLAQEGDPASPLVGEALARLLSTSDGWDELRLGVFTQHFNSRLQEYVRQQGELPATWDNYLRTSHMAPVDYQPQTTAVQPAPGQMAVTLAVDPGGKVLRMVVQPAIGPAIPYYWLTHTSEGFGPWSAFLHPTHIWADPTLPTLEYRTLMSTLIPSGGPP
ncbi:MAG TPA: hypothetical protein VEI97_13305 [bacterium]|nr:hypothetical protein [bacterium]